MALLQTLLLRAITTAVTLLGVAVIVFFVIRVVPGNPIAMMLPPGATAEDIANLTAIYGLDKSIPQQFFIWGTGVLGGDFGTSITLKQPVLELVLGRLPATLELSVLALVMAIVIGGAAALTGTRMRETRVEGGIDVAQGMALTVPDFLWGLVLILVFGVLVPVFQPGIPWASRPSSFPYECVQVDLVFGFATRWRYSSSSPLSPMTEFAIS